MEVDLTKSWSIMRLMAKLEDMSHVIYKEPKEGAQEL